MKLMTRRLRTAACSALLAAGTLAASAALAQVNIRIGHGSAAEETLWLMKADPKVTPGQGKAYKLDYTLFRGSDKRFQAFEAGELDIATGSAHSVMMAAAEGAKFKIVATISREGAKGFATRYMVKEDSPIKTIADLKGKNLGINGARSSSELWARLALEKKGLDTKKEVNWVALPFPSQGEAVRAGKLDVGAFPQPFAAFEEKRGGLRTIFTSQDGIARDEDLMVLMVSEKFATQQPAVLRAFLADLVRATTHYVKNPKEARTALVDAKLVGIPLDVFLTMKDYERPLDGRVDMESIKAMTAELSKFGFITKPVNAAAFVDNSFLPK
jgi:ABC-type nitrate/sulfonate/bicarbonate transport system substrate-binding protein